MSLIRLNEIRPFLRELKLCQNIELIPPHMMFYFDAQYDLGHLVDETLEARGGKKSHGSDVHI